MTRRVLAGLAAGLLLTAQAASAAPACAPKAEGPVVQAVVGMYAAVKASDRAHWAAAVTPDFYAFDGGAKFTGEGLFAMVKGAQAQGKVYEWTVNEPRVRIDCTLAAVTYVNLGGVTDATGRAPLTWLETALLTWDKGVWRVAFLESFRAKPAP
jgi:hypothetical protein